MILKLGYGLLGTRICGRLHWLGIVHEERLIFSIRSLGENKVALSIFDRRTIFVCRNDTRDRSSIGIQSNSRSTLWMIQAIADCDH